MPDTTPPFPTRGDKAMVEQGLSLQPSFDVQGLIPCIAQDAATGDILMFAWMNDESLRATIATGIVHYWSRSRGKLWQKGESSGNVQKVVELRTDCDQDVILVKIEQIGGAACHTGHRSCFYRKLQHLGPDTDFALAVEGEPLFDPKSVYGS